LKFNNKILASSSAIAERLCCSVGQFRQKKETRNLKQTGKSVLAKSEK